MKLRSARPTVEQLVAGVQAGDRALLARAITLVESNSPRHRKQAQELLQAVLPSTGQARRVGVTGVPGVGKSTFIESFGIQLTEMGHRPAVLAVDPSSSVSGGSILGDKTRMNQLSVHPQAFVRPSPSAGSLGGVARKTRESMLLCEAAGYDVVLVETVGVGQSEIMVAEMVDSVLLLLLPGAGDELQGIKRGILELIDVAVVNKAEGERQTAARQARLEYESGLRLIRPGGAGWTPPVLTASGLAGLGLKEVWQALESHRRCLEAGGGLKQKRSAQQLSWMWSLLRDGLLARFKTSPSVVTNLEAMEARVATGELTPSRAADRLMTAFAEDQARSS